MLLEVLFFGVRLIVVSQTELTLDKADDRGDDKPAVVAFIKTDFLNNVVLILVEVGSFAKFLPISRVGNLIWFAPLRNQLPNGRIKLLFDSLEGPKVVTAEQLHHYQPATWNLVVQHLQTLLGVIEEGSLLSLRDDEHHARILFEQFIGRAIDHLQGKSGLSILR